MPTLDFSTANVAGGATRCKLQIHHYWEEDKINPNGQSLETPSFNAGDCYWCIYCDPEPDCIISTPTTGMSISVALDGRVARPIKARFVFSLLDRNGEPVPGHTVCTNVRKYSRAGSGYGSDVFIRKESLEEMALEYPVDADCFTIRCDVAVYRPSPLSNLQQQHLLDTKSDVTFQVAGEKFSAHRCVLAARSPVFKAELSRASTSGSSCIRIDDMLPQVFKTLQHFVYTDSLPEVTGVEGSMMAEHLLAAADRFGMQGLKLICEEKLIRELNENTAAKILKLAVQHNSSFLREACFVFLSDPPVLEAAMAMDDGLLEQVAKICPALLKKMWAYEDDPMQDELDMCLTVCDEFLAVI